METTQIAGGNGQLGEPKRNIYEMLFRMAVGVLISLVRRRIKKKREQRTEGKKAARQVAKLQKKGKEAPADLKKTAVKGMSRRAKKKMRRKAKKKRARKIGKKIIWAIVLAAIAIAVVSKTKK